MKLETKTVNMVSDCDWDDLVMKVYCLEYCLQQQDGCRDRGVLRLEVPDNSYDDSQMPDSVPEDVHTDHECGVQFEIWKKSDPDMPLKGGQPGSNLVTTWWQRAFYPHPQAVANDLHSRGLLPAGEYLIDIQW